MEILHILYNILRVWPQKASEIMNAFLFHGNYNSQIQQAILRNLNQLYTYSCWKKNSSFSQAASLSAYSEAQAQPYGHLPNSSTTVLPLTPDLTMQIQRKVLFCLFSTQHQASRCWLCLTPLHHWMGTRKITNPGGTK